MADNNDNHVPYEKTNEGLLFHLRDDVEMLIRWRTSTKTVVELWRGHILMPPDTGNLNSAGFRQRLAKAAKDTFAELTGMDELGNPILKDTVPNILEDLGKVALALSSKSDPDDEGGEGKTLWDALQEESPMMLMLKYASEGATYFHDATPTAYATCQINGEGGHLETYPIYSRRYKLWLKQEWRRREEERKKAASGKDEEKAILFPDRALHEVASHFEAIAIFEGEEREVFLRVAGHDGKIYVDLCDAAWRVVEISQEGWKVIPVSDAPVRFIRATGMLPLPKPEEREGALEEFRGMLNVGKDEAGERNWKLILAWLLQAFRPKGPYPVLALLGPHGAAKSATQRIIRNTVDPNAAPIRSKPKDEHNIYIDAIGGWIIALENQSFIPAWLSDVLCSLATGGGFTTRRLYTDLDQVIFDAMRPSTINGIGDIIVRPDLLDRALIANLPSIAKRTRKQETKLFVAVEALKPGVLAALFDVISKGLSKEAEVEIEELPRMADFAIWVSACEEALGWEPGSFMAAYLGSQEDAVETALESWPMTSAFIIFAKNYPGDDKAWVGTATELLSEVNDLEESDALRRSKGWPKQPNKLTEALNRLAPAFLEMGIHIERPPGTRREGRKIKVFYVEGVGE